MGTLIRMTKKYHKINKIVRQKTEKKEENYRLFTMSVLR